VWIHNVGVRFDASACVVVGTYGSIGSGTGDDMIGGSGDLGTFSTLMSSTSVDLFHRFVSEVSSDVKAMDELSASSVPARSRLRDGWFAMTAMLGPQRRSGGVQLRGTMS